MEQSQKTTLHSFYQTQLKKHILPFWLSHCQDTEYGGYLNCFNNSGTALVSRDKYTWSQGRFVWIWSKLASTSSNTFTQAEKQSFLALAKQGASFLMEHCLIAPDDWRCVFLMSADGSPKFAEDTTVMDASIFADCFVAAGLARYSSVSGDTNAWQFAKRLMESISQRIETNSYHSLPYPLGDVYQMHSIPMILTNLSCEMFRAAQVLEPILEKKYLSDIQKYQTADLTTFVDAQGILHEIVRRDGASLPGLFGDHINPGHTLEDCWFQMEAADILGNNSFLPMLYQVSLHALNAGWDQEYGGLYHFTNSTGGIIACDGPSPYAAEPQFQQVCSDWSSKLWWVHAEALYTTLLFALRSQNPLFWEHYTRISAYTFGTFPNKNHTIGEWEQIRDRKGTPLSKVVALPVKDPYHIIRSMIQIIELLESKDDNILSNTVSCQK